MNVRRSICTRIGWLPGLLVLLTHGPFGWADTLKIGSGDAGAIEIRDATITKIEGGFIYFMAYGKETTRELSKVQKIEVDGEVAFNSAENAFEAGKWSDAVDGYQRTIRSTTRAWLKDYATTRLVEAGSRSGRFDAASTAYIAMLLKDPASAAGITPAMPTARSTYLDQAVGEVNAALRRQELSDGQRQALVTFLMDLHRARKDKSSEEQAAELLDEILAKDPNNPAAAQAIARRKLLSASRALEAGDYRQTIELINSTKSRFTEPQQQAEAMFLIAEATFGLADPSNPDSLKDAAIAYMRVVAHFKAEPARSYVARSMLKTAEIHEQLGEPQAAIRLYEQIVRQFEDDPASQVARQNLRRLGQQAGSD